jgi:hypothetical protein
VEESADVGVGHSFMLGGSRVALAATQTTLRQTVGTETGMRTIFVRVTREASPSCAPVLARPITSTTFSIESVHPDFIDAALEFGAGDNVRCKTVRLRGPGESKARHRRIAVERIP